MFLFCIRFHSGRTRRQRSLGFFECGGELSWTLASGPARSLEAQIDRLMRETERVTSPQPGRASCLFGPSHQLGHLSPLFASGAILHQATSSREVRLVVSLRVTSQVECSLQDRPRDIALAVGNQTMCTHPVGLRQSRRELQLLVLALALVCQQRIRD